MSVAILREEIQDLQSCLDGLPDEFRQGPIGEVYGARLEGLNAELAQEELRQASRLINRPAMNLRLSNPKHVAGRVSLELLGEFLSVWQNLFSALGQAADGRPTARGAVPAEILDRTSLDVVAFAPGSFIVRLVLDHASEGEIPGTELGVAAWHEFEHIVEAGPDRHKLELEMKRLKGRVLSGYTKLLSVLQKWDTNLDVTFCESPIVETMTTHRLGLDHVNAVLPVLGDVEPSTLDEERYVYTAVLNGANKRTKSFEIDLGEEGTIVGKTCPSVNLDGVVIGKLQTFTLLQVVSRDPLTDTVDSTWLLEKVQPAIIAHPKATESNSPQF